ncbi:MAG: ROK family protein [Zoogloeaceae bacterium]|nr:ROK family protein [Zoogloeaceae bacterium]MCP5437171.1 ROK family protein [Chromatiaceae bacterium]MCP5439293.1 ROK family protein [Chromatiaceae bacterium]
MMNILVVDVGGSHVKIMRNGEGEERKMSSGPDLSAQAMVDGVTRMAHDWTFDVVSIGYPGPVVHGRPLHDPVNLGPGWAGFDFAAGFGRPVKLCNDAAMQALGSYRGGRMLFLGLGTGLGSAMIVDGVLEPMELAHLPYKKHTFEYYVGEAALEKRGKRKWRKAVDDVVARLQAALEPDYVVIGGGNVRHLDSLPPGVQRGDNKYAFVGGVRLWETDRPASNGAPGQSALQHP